MILCSAEPRIISCLPTHVINLVINDNSLEILYLSHFDNVLLHFLIVYVTFFYGSYYFFPPPFLFLFVLFPSPLSSLIGWWWWWWWWITINGSSTPTMRPKTGFPVQGFGAWGQSHTCSFSLSILRTTSYYVIILPHLYQAAVVINMSNFLICFCSFDLSCPILEKDIFIENVYMSCLTK